MSGKAAYCLGGWGKEKGAGGLAGLYGQGRE